MYNNVLRDRERIIYSIYIYMCINVYVVWNMCQSGLKRRWNTRKLVVDKECKKIKIHLYQSRRSQHVANACWTSSHCVCVNMRERTNGDVLRFVTVAFGSDNVRKTDRSRFAEPNRLYIWCLHIWWQDRIYTILFNWPSIDTFLC